MSRPTTSVTRTCVWPSALTCVAHVASVLASTGVVVPFCSTLIVTPDNRPAGASIVTSRGVDVPTNRAGLVT